MDTDMTFFKVQSQHLLGRTRKKHRKLHWGQPAWRPKTEFNSGPLK